MPTASTSSPRFVSRPERCLLDLLWRWRRGELDCDIPRSWSVVSNHEDLRADVAMFGVRYVHIPVERGAKTSSGERLLEVFGGEYDLIVLARYMQILSPDFLARHSDHQYPSLLPPRVRGADP